MQKYPEFPTPDPDWRPWVVSLCVYSNDNIIHKQEIHLIWGDTMGSMIYTDVVSLNTRRAITQYINWWIQIMVGNNSVIELDSFWGNSEEVMVSLKLNSDGSEPKFRVIDANNRRWLNQFVLHPDAGEFAGLFAHAIAYKVIEVPGPGVINIKYSLEDDKSLSETVDSMMAQGYQRDAPKVGYWPLIGDRYRLNDSTVFVGEHTMIPINEEGLHLMPEVADLDIKDKALQLAGMN